MRNIELYPYSKPALAGGEYKLDVWHSMAPVAPPDATLPTSGASSVTLKVLGPSLRLEPDAILGGFPAPDESAATGDRLPYLVFKNETLPWMFSQIPTTGNTDRIPTWLALVAVKSTELVSDPVPLTTPLTAKQCRFYRDQPLSKVFENSARQASEKAGPTPAIGLATDLCDQLEMGPTALWTLVPPPAEAVFTAHVRRIEKDEFAGDDDGFVAVVLGTRQLEGESRYHFFLISLQERNVDALLPLVFGGKTARFVVLHHFEARTGAATRDFKEQITAVNRQPWGRSKNGAAITITGSSVVLSQQKRDGTVGESLYHGPLVDTIPNTEVVHVPKLRLSQVAVPSVTVAGKTRPEISYQAAFELGRLLALSERSWLSALMDYRRRWQHQRAWEVMQSMPMAEQVRQVAADPALKTSGSQPPPPPSVLKKLFPLEGMANLLANPIQKLVVPGRLSAATVSDNTGIKHLVNRTEVPGLNLTVVAAEKYGITTQLNATAVTTVDSTVLNSLVATTNSNAEKSAALASETNTASQLKSASVKPPPAASLVDGNLFLKGTSSGSTQKKGGSSSTSNRPAPHDTLMNWLYDLCLLKRVPFTYLVPHAALLPPESMRLFYLDAEWLWTLVDGTLGAGLGSSLDMEIAEDLASRVHQELEIRLKTGKKTLAPGQEYVLNEPLIITGLLMRSALVRQCPNMLIRGLNGTQQLRVLRREALSADCVLVLFSGQLSKVEFHEPADGLRYGAVLKPNNGAQIPWQDPAGVAADVALNFTQTDATARTLNLGRSSSVSLVASLDPRLGYTTNSHHVAWALQRDPCIFTLDRSVASGGGMTETGGADPTRYAATVKTSTAETSKTRVGG